VAKEETFTSPDNTAAPGRFLLAFLYTALKFMPESF
jgi:hypothetical protein